MKFDELNEAIFSNDLEKLEQLLKAGTDPHQSDGNGVSTLFHAINFGSVGAVKLLLDYGADINQVNWRSRTPWLLAVETADLAKITLLRSRGADTCAKNDLGQNALHYAVIRGREDLFKEILEHTGCEEVLHPDRWGNTILHLAASWHNLPLVKICLTKTSVPIDAQNHSGETAFLRATRERQIPIAQTLVDANCNINLADKNLEYPLLTSVRANHVPFIQLLLSRGANINCTDKNGATPLLIAIRAVNLELAKLLLDAHADPEIRDKNLDTPMLAAIKNNSIEMVEMLLSYKVSINYEEKELQNALRDVNNPGILQRFKVTKI